MDGADVVAVEDGNVAWCCWVSGGGYWWTEFWWKERVLERGVLRLGVVGCECCLDGFAETGLFIAWSVGWEVPFAAASILSLEEVDAHID